MLRKVDSKLFEGLEEEKNPSKKFNVKWPQDPDDFAKTVWKDVIAYCKFGKNKQAYKVLFLDGDTLERRWFYLTPKWFGYLKRWNQHCEERISHGASYRDAWDVNWWLASAIPEALKHLREDMHGYPVCAIDLWNKLAEITGDEKMDEAAISDKVASADGKKLTDADVKQILHGSDFMSDDTEKFNGIDDLRFKTWQKCIERLEFLFREYNENTCSMKNPYKFEWHYDWKPIKGTSLTEMVWNGTDEQKAEHDRYSSRSIEIDLYRAECLHKAMKILEIFIEYLWD